MHCVPILTQRRQALHPEASMDPDDPYPPTDLWPEHSLGSEPRISAGNPSAEHGPEGRATALPRYHLTAEERRTWTRKLRKAASNPAAGERALKSLNAAIRCGHDHLVFRERGSGEFLLTRYQCGRKFCPSCLEAWSDSLKARALRSIRGIPPTDLRHLVLTIPNPETGDLARGMEQLFRSWREWRNEGRREGKSRKPWWTVDGCASKLEVHWSARAGWHPHIHAIVHAHGGVPLTRNSPGRQAWSSISGRYGPPASEARGIYISAPKNAVNAAEEVTKYAAKPIPLRGLPPERIAELSSAAHGRRWHASSGTLSLGPAREPSEKDLEFLGIAGALIAQHLYGATSPRKRDIALGMDIAVNLAAVLESDEQRTKHRAWSAVAPLMRKRESESGADETPF